MKHLYPLLVCAALILAIQNLAFAAEGAFKHDGGMTWPMLPNESIGELSVKFYPHNVAMQQQFVAKTLQLNKENLPNLDQKTRFAASTAILIPNLKSLATGTKAIKFHRKKVKSQPLHLSYNIKETLEPLPKALIDEYEQLLARNEYLKTEIAKLDERLSYLQNKLTSLKQVLEKIIVSNKQDIRPSSQPKTETTDVATLQSSSQSANPVQPDLKASQPIQEKKAIQPTLPTKIDEQAQGMVLPGGLSVAEWIVTLLVLLLAVLGIQYLLKKRQQRAIAFLTADSIMPKPIKIGQALDEIVVPDIDAELAMPFNTSTQVDEYKERSILDEAKILVQKGSVDEAISHLKWAIRAQPKTAIGVWLYLLTQLRVQNHKEDFERYAFEMHQTFNVMTPLWSNQKPADIVIAENLEAFTHIAKDINKLWPSEKCKQYLQALIADNRNGERSGFSQEVVDEILFLIELQDERLQLDEFQVSI